MNNAAIIATALPLIKEAEGFRSEVYLDVAGIPTIGYGTTEYPDGRKVLRGNTPITETMAKDFLKTDISKRWRVIKHSLTTEPTVNQAAAMLSLAYNIGATAFMHSTLVRLFNMGKTQRAADQFYVWDKATIDGKLVSVPGLARRRERERELFLKGTE